MEKIISFVVKTVFICAAFTFIFKPEAFGAREDLFNDISLTSLKNSLQSIDLAAAAPWLVFAALIKIAGIFAGVIRWRILLRAQGVHIPFWYLTKCWFWGRAIGLFLPGTLGLDAYRLVESSRYTGEVVKCTTVVVVEKLTGFIALFTIVFLTLPLGLHLFNSTDAVQIKPMFLAAVLLILGGFIAVSLIFLLQPRIIQVLAAVLPVPKKLRQSVDKIGAAVTAYSHHRGSLFAALFFGLCVHLAICLMYFGTAMAITGDLNRFTQVLFASPLIIVGSVFAPTVSGMGVRELVMTTLLGASAGAERAFLIGHLGLWFGEVVPFVLSLPLLLFTTAPKREALLEEMDAVRNAARRGAEPLHLEPEVIKSYEKKVFGCIAAGLLAGLAAGAFIGLAESFWLWKTLPGLTETQMYFWGPIVYGLLFGCVGTGIAFGLLFLYLLFDRFASYPANYALSFAGSLAVGGLVIGLWRFQRDVLAGQAGTTMQYAQVAAYILGAVLIIGAAAYVKTALFSRITRRCVISMGAACVLAWVLPCGLGYWLAGYLAPEAPVREAVAADKAGKGPNMILVAVDTLRADYLPLYGGTEAKTPKLDEFAKEALLFENGASQASWTKPSFGVLFTGLYPEMHTATGKLSALPASVDTLAELLQAGGYWTQAFANNPNISPIFGFDQGFSDYGYLKPDLYFWASDSASKLSMYEVLRKARMRFMSKLSFLFKMRVTDYYQPAEVVTEHALDWLDTAPKDQPYFLFLHYMDPHDPYMAPESKTGGYARANMEHPDPDEFEEPMRQAYIQEINYLDTELGVLFEGLEKRGIFNDTLIVFTSDHGEELLDHGGWWHGFTLYEEMLHVPFIIKLPGNAHAGERNMDLARHVDLAPTFLHFAGLPKGAAMPGQALFDTGRNVTNLSISFAYAENNFEGNVLRSVKSLSSKLIEANEDNVSGLAPVEVYDLSVDPKEQNNVAGKEFWEVGLHDALADYQKVIQEGAAEPSGAVDVSGEVESQMKSLGYLGN